MKKNTSLIAEVCRMHYLDNLSQNKISSNLRVSKSAVSRLLKEGRDKGIVTFHIKDYEDRLSSLEDKLEQSFKLKEAVVVSDEEIMSEESIKKKVAKAAAILLQRRIREDDTITVSWGTTLAEVAKALNPPSHLNIDIVPLLGGIDITGRDIHSNEIARRASEAFKGKYYVLNAPVFVSNLQIKETFEKEKSIKAVIDKAKSADIAVVGIGSPKQSSTMIKRGYFSFKEFAKLTDKGVIGDICTNFYDIRGNILNLSLHNKMVGLGLKELKHIPIVIGVACCEAKKEAILGALRGGHVNIIVTNKKVAEYLIENTK
ncbi:MAG: sugar-binding transcriptional regulator [Candidatus Atribacteria bacterium]|jgi:DNA-binding transcriptional regulator LsrR (DeoR family)|nr:sugar-binding transcriptional regulator [Candidatus Atribacteria bacterium]